MPKQKIDLKGVTLSKIEKFFLQIDQPKYRAKQLCRWIYEKRISDIDRITDFSKELRESLNKIAYLSDLKIVKKQESKLDKTLKYLLKTEDGQHIETVFILDKKRNTICISTQVGCSLKCSFCLTGESKFKRNLTAAEIVDQILTVQNDIGENKKISNVVFMGMGEPLLNYDNLIKAIMIMTAPWGLRFSARKVTVSTAGIVPAIYKLEKENVSIRLAISLNAATDKKREVLMPINKKYPLKDLLKAAKKFAQSASRYLTFEYVLIKGINDSKKDAFNLIKLLKSFPCKINLIPYNESPNTEDKKPDKKEIMQFKNLLNSYFKTVTIRESTGSDILAACGQLKGRKINGTPS